MTTRLDRLFVLLENGSSALTRRAAAQQLGDVQKMHPHELYSLLDRVHPYLHNASWDCRIAAAQAVEAIVAAVPLWRPQPCDEPGLELAQPHLELRLESFSVADVLETGPILTSVETADADAAEAEADLTTQRKLLNKRLGMDIAEKLGLDTSSIFSNEDLTSSPPSSPAALGTTASSREANLQRRRQRELQRQRSQAAAAAAAAAQSGSAPGPGEPPCKLARTEASAVTPQRRRLATYVTAERWEEGEEWPLEGWCELLCDDLLAPQWEVRHGSVTALRETLKAHGCGAGRRQGLSESQTVEWRRRRLEDLALRLLRVLALDRLGDYVSDQVVAPVRETAAQALGAVLHLAAPASAAQLGVVVLALLQRPEWEVRHGGQLALRYLLAVRADQLPAPTLTLLLQAALRGLHDPCDDVSAVAASCLVSNADAVVRLLPADTVAGTLATLWDSLPQLDELTTSTPAVMELLATLSSRDVSAGRSSLSSLVPRLWPFLGHTSSSVRRSAALTLCQLVSTQELSEWSADVVQAALRLTFQRALLEDQDSVLQLLVKVWRSLVSRTPLATLLTATCPHISGWLCLLMQPTRMAINPALLITVPRPTRRDSGGGSGGGGGGAPVPQYLGGPAAAAAGGADRERAATRARLTGASLLGALSPYIVQPMPGAVYTDESPLDTFVSLLGTHLSSLSALQRAVVGHIISEWVQAAPGFAFPEPLVSRVHTCLAESVCYDETAVAFTRLQQDCRDYIALLKHYSFSVDDSFQTARVLSFEQIRQLSGPVSEALLERSRLQAKVLEKLQDRRHSVRRTGAQVCDEQTTWSVRTQLALARAAVLMQRLTEKLNPVVRPLMEGIKREADTRLQGLASDSVVRLLELHRGRETGPVAKIITNLCSFSCCDPLNTPAVCELRSDSRPSTPVTPGTPDCAPASPLSAPLQNELLHGIISLERIQQAVEDRTGRRGPAPRPAAGSGTTTTATAVGTPAAAEDSAAAAELQAQREVQRRGACGALAALCQRSGSAPPARLLELSLLALDAEPAPAPPLQQVQALVNALQVTEVVAPALHSSVQHLAMTRLPRVRRCLTHRYKAVRHMAARCLAALARLDLHRTMAYLVDHVLPLLGDASCSATRQGAVEAVSCLLESLWMEALPYIVLLVVPVLGRMSDRDSPVRLAASRAFGAVIQLMPLEPGCRGADQVPAHLRQRKRAERRFLDQLMDPASIEEVAVPSCVRAQLRPYQRRGLSWLAFLNKYQLHGVLCDDMGLGKSLQSLCMLAADQRERHHSFQCTGSVEFAPLPSLIVCPPTLTGHWMYEVEKFVDPSELSPLHYFGLPVERQRLQARLPHHNLVIASYDIVRNDLEWFGGIRWNYCILDEGHIIKNGKTKVARAIKQLDAAHRLILTGTPLQNSVLELWSLFDFLMPGFLGTERQFTARYSRPILQSRDAKANSREQEAGALAMEALHRQVLPFLLRRLKEDVLDDLPPKITQDYYCELSDVQKRLYEDFARSQAQIGLVEGLDGAETGRVERAPAHVFQALQYLRKVCNHPKLVLTEQHPGYATVQSALSAQSSSLDEIQHSAKLVALRQLLVDLGIGAEEELVHPHRALIFCQLKSMADLVERDLLRRHLPAVTYLRLDGSVPAGDRQRLVHRFNTDPSIDCLLLTTQVGGLGLNLVGADTVIFVEHDWNPMKDLQAMDRAHRIGQKRVVNVYRLITRGTLEEKIMGLQKFKLMTANTVITSENSSLLTMGTDQLFDLFTLEAAEKEGGRGGAAAEARGIRAMLESLPELWEGEQYEQEYDLTGFMKTLRTQRPA